MEELRWTYERLDAFEARRDLKTHLEKWPAKYFKRRAWVEANIEETRSFYQLPLAHGKRLKNTKLEHFNHEIERRTQVVRIFQDKTLLPATDPPWPSVTHGERMERSS